MKISDLLVNALMSTHLFEMAFAKKVAMDRARDLQLTVAQHLVKIVMYSSSTYVYHWKKEIDGWLRQIQSRKLRGTNQPLNERDLFLILFDEPLGTLVDVQDMMNQIYENYPDLEIDQPSAGQVSQKLSWMMSNVCKDMAQKQFKGIDHYDN